jgi:hypothetical protein
MSAPADMEPLLQQWRRMTKAETEAIRASAWPKLREIQSNKALLKASLNQAMAKLRAQQSSEVRTGSVDLPFRAEVNRLISLEAHNAQLVASNQKKLVERRRQLERASQNLRRIRGSYAPPVPGALNSLS